MRTRTLFFLLLLVSPVFWWIILQPSKIFSDVVKTPSNISNKVANVASEEKVLGIQDMRWAQVDTEGTTSIVSKIFYNKFLTIPDEAIDYLTFLLPKFYFQAGDGSQLSPPGVEPIAAILFPFFIIGTVGLIKEKKLKVFFVILASSFVAYVSGRKTISFLFPVLLGYLYLASVGILRIRNTKLKKVVIIFVVIYSLYMLARALWINS